MYRNANSDDLDCLKAISKEVIRTNYTPFLGDTLVSQFIDSGAADAELDSGIDSCVVLEETRVIGFGITMEDLLHLLMVKPEYQHLGHGTELLLYIEEIMFKKYPVIRLQTFETNTAAIAFYLKNGWDEVGRQAIEELGVRVVLLEKKRP